MAGELAKRVAVAIVGIPAAILLIYLGGWYIAGLLAVLAALGTLEFYRLARTQGAEPFELAGAAAAAVLVLSAASEAPSFAAMRVLNAYIALLLLFTGLAIWRRGPQCRPLSNIAATFCGMAFIGGTLSYGVWLRAYPDFSTQLAPLGVRSAAWQGTALVVFPLAVTWINDSLAYFVGRAIGRHKLIPTVSPGKTIEGAVAGLIGGVITAVAIGRFVLGPEVGIAASPLIWALGGAVIAAVAQVGDLAESLLKREAKVKDSGTLFPGHGGVLDRLDALFFAVPVAYWFLRWVGLK